MARFEDKVFGWIDANGLYNGAGRVLLAVSGGVDSVVMVHVLERLRRAGRLRCGFVIGHVNHGLRGADSEQDAVFVTDLGRRLGIEVVSRDAAVREYAAADKLSIETAGRLLRLEALAAMADEQGCDAIATAHHADDQAETLAHRLLRGTGFRGLCGIRPVSVVHGGRFVRPLLGIRRAEIVEYAETAGIAWREDVTNHHLTFMRNRIRHRLLPALTHDAPALVERLCWLAVTSGRFLARAEQQAAAVVDRGQLNPVPGRFEIDAALLRDCPPWVFYEVIRQVLVNLEVGLQGYTQSHFELIRGLLDEDGGRADFPGHVDVVVDAGKVVIHCGRDAAVGGDHRPYGMKLPVGQAIRFGAWTISARWLDRGEVDVERFLKTKDRFVEWFDADKIRGDIDIRGRRDGDRFWPIGAKGPKKVGRFLQDAGLEANVRHHAFVIADTEKILWVAPLRMAEPVKVTERTTRILEIRIHR